MRIKTITAVNQKGIKSYQIDFMYNGFKLHKILDRSREYETHTDFIFYGYTEQDKLIFQIINIPVDVEYMGD